MVKLAGAVMTGFACGYVGFRMRMRLKIRLRSLREICTSLEALESEIDFSLDRLTKSLIRADTNGLFTLAAEKMDKMYAGEALNAALYEMQDELCLKDADIEAVMILGRQLGKTDAANQIKNIRYVKNLVSSQASGAEEDYTRLGSLFSTGGILAGILIVILLI